jgi:hypothetical protein
MTIPETHRGDLAAAAVSDPGGRVGRAGRRLACPAGAADRRRGHLLGAAGTPRREGRVMTGLMLTPRDRRLILSALAIAAAGLRGRAARCPDCETSPARPCPVCDERLDRAAEFDALALRIGGGS